MANDVINQINETVNNLQNMLPMLPELRGLIMDEFDGRPPQHVHTWSLFLGALETDTPKVIRILKAMAKDARKIQRERSRATGDA